MADIERPEQLPDSETGAQPLAPSALSAQKGRRSLSKVRRELSDDELSSPAVQRMLIDEIERLERESTELADFRDRYYQTEKRVAVLEEKAKVSLSGEVIFGICLTIGAASLGYAPSVWEHQPSGWLSIAFGAILIVGGIASKVVKR